jgi:hypothetical protein
MENSDSTVSCFDFENALKTQFNPRFPQGFHKLPDHQEFNNLRGTFRTKIPKNNEGKIENFKIWCFPNNIPGNSW